MGFWDVVTSAGPQANNLHLAPDEDINTSSVDFFTGRVLFLTTN